MCNALHGMVTEIPPRGTGWKLFIKLEDGTLCPLTNGHGRYISLWRLHPSGAQVIPWTSIKHVNIPSAKVGIDTKNKDQGFCFFKSRKGLGRAILDYIKFVFGHTGVLGSPPQWEVVLRKIHYGGGLGEITERSFLAGRSIRMCLCKNFHLSKAAIKRGEHF